MPVPTGDLALVVMMPRGDDVQNDGEDHGEQSKRGEVAVPSTAQHGDLPQAGGQFGGVTTILRIVPPDEERNCREYGDVERGMLAHGVKNGMLAILRQRQITE